MLLRFQIVDLVRVFRGTRIPAEGEHPFQSIVNTDSGDGEHGHARDFIERGRTVLVPDRRGHEPSEGKHTTLRGREREDVRTGMRFLRTEGLADTRAVLMGHSMGAVAVLLAAAGETNVRAVDRRGAVRYLPQYIAHHAWVLYRLPSSVPIIPLTFQFAEWRAGFDADTIDTVAAARRIQAPLLAIVDGQDDRTPEEVVRRIIDAHRSPNELWVAPGAGHVGAILTPDWKNVVLSFLESHDIADLPPKSGRSTNASRIPPRRG